MGYRADEVKLGFVIILSFLILVGFIIAIIGFHVGRKTVTYTTSLKYIAGIDRGRTVRFGGMQVGHVSEVSISPKDESLILVEMAINKGTPIKTDSAAYANTIGFLGDYYMEISTGTKEAAILPPGSEIAGRKVASLNEVIASAGGVIEKLSASLGIINKQVLLEEVPELRQRVEVTADNLDKLLKDLDAVITENRKDINQIVTQLTQLLQENREGVAAVVANFREASQKLNSLADMLDSIVAENRNDVDTIIKQLRKAADEAQAAAEKVNGLISQNADNFANTIENLEATSANFETLSEELEQEPWRLLWRTKPPEKQELSK
jgi:phospholipid/cholesterol/gamma-HCH transport system substrate-binding protein